MNKTEFIAKISDKTEVSKEDVKAVIDALPDIIKDTVISGDRILLTGFVTFEKRHVEEKSGKVMMGDKKGSTWTKPACDVIVAKLSKSYKEI